MFRMVTVEREYGAGGSVIARRVAETMNWNLLDSALIRTVAQAAHVDTAAIQKYDEHVESWWRRFNRNGLRAVALHAGVAPVYAESFGGETVARLTQEAIIQASDAGSCIIVGRGAGCILQGRQDVLSVFIYGSWQDRVSRIRSRGESRDSDTVIRTKDRERATYIRTYYGCDWKDPHLYHMMISSHIGIENVRWAIVDAILHSAGAAAA